MRYTVPAIRGKKAMDFGTAIRTCFQKYAVFSGRARRSEYWYFFLFGVLVNIATSIVETVINAATSQQVPIGGLVSLALFLPQLAVNVRRIHDTDRSGWLVGGFYLYCVAALAACLPFIEMFRTGAIAPIWLFCGLAALIGPYAIFLFVLTVLPGTHGANRYGPDPTAPVADVF